VQGKENPAPQTEERGSKIWAILKAFFFFHPAGASAVFGGYSLVGCLRCSRLRRVGVDFALADDLLGLHRNLPFVGRRLDDDFVPRDVFGWVCDYLGVPFSALAVDPAR